MIAVDATSGSCLGLVGGDVWSRDGVNPIPHRHIQLTQGRDGTDQMPASNAFTESEIDTLAALGPTLEGSTERQQNHHPMRSLAWAAWIIARLGGWNCYYTPLTR
jgi:hypothetical protein